MKIDLLGVNINSDSKIEILQELRAKLNSRKSIFIVTPYSEMIVRAQNDPEFREILNSAAFALPDGVGILWSANYLKRKNFLASLFAIIFDPKKIRDPIPEKISGSDFIWDLARLAGEKNYSIFLLGGYDDTPKLAAKKLQEKFPNLKIAGFSSPAHDDEIGDREIGQINTARADFLFVALGPIRQEKWIAKNLPKLSVKLVMGVGGTLDYLASKRTLAPQIWRKGGLEWLWRLLTQPWRFWRISRGVLGLIYYTLQGKKSG